MRQDALPKALLPAGHKKRAIQPSKKLYNILGFNSFCALLFFSLSE